VLRLSRPYSPDADNLLTTREAKKCSNRAYLPGCFMSKFQSLIQPLIAAALVCFCTIPSLADSQIRIVRLSDVQGDVQVDRKTGQGFEKAFLNLPITQGMMVRTGSDGRAELQLEDASSLRLTPNTAIEISQLSLRDSGAKVSEVHLQEGTAYVNLLTGKDDELTLTFVREKILLTQAAHLRVELGDTKAAVAVFKGEVDVTGPSGTTKVEKNHTAKFDLLDDSTKVAGNIEQQPLDAWDKQQNQYDELYSATAQSNNNYSPYNYGNSDLNYYGNFFSLPGYGTLWQPYFAGTGWDPFMNGAWAFNPGLGYGWVSGYPWGWTPYHYGSWVFVSPYGWLWEPGGAWMGYNAIPTILNAPAGYMPPRSPILPGQRIIPSNHGPALLARYGNKIDLLANSAGLGIPRGTVRNLSRLSETAQEHGYATAKIGSIGSSGWRGGYASPGTSAWEGGGPVASSSGHASGGHAGGHR
jgi:hypothetical protein